MGCVHSKLAVHDGNDPSDGKKTMVLQLSTYYEQACRLDPELRALEPLLLRPTSRVISALAADAAALRSLSFKSLQEATDGFAGVSRDAFATILEVKEDISNNPDLLRFVRDYFKNNVNVLKFFAALRGCLQRARETEGIISEALDHFANEKYSETLDKLREFEAAGDPFTESFLEEFRSVCQQQQSVLDELRVKKDELDKQLGSSKAWRKVWSLIYAVAFAAVLICTVVLAAVSAPPAATAAVAAASAAAPPLWQWLGSFWDGYDGSVRGQRETAAALHGGTAFAIHELESIRVLVERLEVHIGVLLSNAGLAIREEEAVVTVVEEIKRKLGTFKKSVEDLEKKVDRCNDDLRKVMAAIVKGVTRGSWFVCLPAVNCSKLRWTAISCKYNI